MNRQTVLVLVSLTVIALVLAPPAAALNPTEFWLGWGFAELGGDATELIEAIWAEDDNKWVNLTEETDGGQHVLHLAVNTTIPSPQTGYLSVRWNCTVEGAAAHATTLQAETTAGGLGGDRVILVSDLCESSPSGEMPLNSTFVVEGMVRLVVGNYHGPPPPHNSTVLLDLLIVIMAAEPPPPPPPRPTNLGEGIWDYGLVDLFGAAAPYLLGAAVLLGLVVLGALLGAGSIGTTLLMGVGIAFLGLVGLWPMWTLVLVVLLLATVLIFGRGSAGGRGDP